VSHPIKPDLLGFPGIGVFACGLRDHVITRFTSDTVQPCDTTQARLDSDLGVKFPTI
jgi:hypothetical protein